MQRTSLQGLDLRLREEPTSLTILKKSAFQNEEGRKLEKKRAYLSFLLEVYKTFLAAQEASVY